MGQVPLVLVIGARQAGKSTFSKALAAALGVVHGDCGELLMQQLPKLKAAGRHAPRWSIQRWLQEIQENKDDFREDLIELGDQYRAIHSDALPLLLRDSFGAGVISGLRTREELSTTMEWQESWWLVEILRKDCPKDNYELGGAYPDWPLRRTFHNDDSVVDLEAFAVWLARDLKAGAA